MCSVLSWRFVLSFLRSGAAVPGKTPHDPMICIWCNGTCFPWLLFTLFIFLFGRDHFWRTHQNIFKWVISPGGSYIFLICVFFWHVSKLSIFNCNISVVRLKKNWLNVTHYYFFLTMLTPPLHMYLSWIMRMGCDQFSPNGDPAQPSPDDHNDPLFSWEKMVASCCFHIKVSLPFNLLILRLWVL